MAFAPLASARGAKERRGKMVLWEKGLGRRNGQEAVSSNVGTSQVKER